MAALLDCTVGDRIPDLHRDLDLQLLVRYAGASGDFNPIHYDEVYARAAGLDSVIGHGALSMALVSQAVTDWLGTTGELRHLAVRFAGPSRLGDRLTVSGEIVGHRLDDAGRIEVDLALTCRRQDGATVVSRAAATAVSVEGARAAVQP